MRPQTPATGWLVSQADQTTRPTPHGRPHGKHRGLRRWLAGGAVGALVAGLGVAAYVQPGMAKAETIMNDAAVWVTNQDRQLVGRFNAAAQALDGALLVDPGSFDVIQDGDTAILTHYGQDQLQPISVTFLTIAGGIALPKATEAKLGGGRAAMLHPASGRLWIMANSELGGFDPTATTPTTKNLSDQTGFAVGQDGTVHVADPLAGQLTSWLPDGTFTTLELPGITPDAVPQVSAIGDQAVVLDPSTNTVYLPNGDQVTIPATTSQPDTDHQTQPAKLQQPGPDASTAVVQTNAGLWVVPLEGGEPSRLLENLDKAATLAGTPTAPAVVAGCVYAVWNNSGAFARDCEGQDNDLIDQVPRIDQDSDLKLRVNRDRVVLNIVPTGQVFSVTGKLIQLDTWDAVEPSQVAGDSNEESNTHTQELANAERGEQQPPEASPDEFGVRPGRSVVLNVTRNDADPNGDLLTVELVGEQPSAVGTVQTVSGGRALQIQVSPDATGQASFIYQADDGMGGTDQAQVTVKVVPDTTNLPPEQVLVDGTSLLGAGATASYDVLNDWQDPEGDALYLVSATLDQTDTQDTLLSRADGVVTFQDAGQSTGIKLVHVVVSDGVNKAAGTFGFDVREPGSAPPIANVDHAIGAVGAELTINVLDNDADPDARGLRVTELELDPAEYPGISVEWHETGEVTLKANQAGTSYLPYQMTDGKSQAEGWIRLDATVTEGASEQPPAAVADKALLPTGSNVLVNVLGNDVDPAGGVLILTGVEVPAGAPVSASVLEHQTLRVNDLGGGFTGPVNLTYTVQGLAGEAQGTVTVLSVPPPAVQQPPVVLDDTATVRAGDIVTIYPLDNDYHPNGLPFALVEDSAVKLDDSQDGLLFTTGDTVRFHAGTQAGTVRVSYQVADQVNDPVSGTITIEVVALNLDTNRRPVPQPIEGGAVAGTTTLVALPLDGVDPDGDYVRFAGFSQAPALGEAVVDQGVLAYTANSDASGLDVFTYLVEDRWGAQAT
ncbi:MAG: hypothetical protein LBR19_01900, partial [Bifidobacteriaceae bacterium]|nr:hypothetical protein [Bifidobacteriaceae bacterium]